MSVAETWFGVNVSELAAACSGICVVFLPSLSLSLFLSLSLCTVPLPPPEKKRKRGRAHGLSTNRRGLVVIPWRSVTKNVNKLEDWITFSERLRQCHGRPNMAWSRLLNTDTLSSETISHCPLCIKSGPSMIGMGALPTLDTESNVFRLQRNVCLAEVFCPV